MAGVVVVTAVSVFLGGLGDGGHRGDRDRDRESPVRTAATWLAGTAPDRLSWSALRLTGVSRRDLDPEFLRPTGGLIRSGPRSTGQCAYPGSPCSPGRQGPSGPRRSLIS